MIIKFIGDDFDDLSIDEKLALLQAAVKSHRKVSRPYMVQGHVYFKADLRHMLRAYMWMDEGTKEWFLSLPIAQMVTTADSMVSRSSGRSLAS